MRARRAGTPPRCRDAAGSHRQRARRGPGGVGNGRIVAYGARSPVWRLGAKHAQEEEVRKCETHALSYFRTLVLSYFEKRSGPPFERRPALRQQTRLPFGFAVVMVMAMLGFVL